MEKVKKYYRNLLNPFLLVRQNLKSLFFFEILYRLLAVMVFFPILTWTQRLYLWFNGTAVITSSNVFPFLKNPLTWLVFILLVFLMTIFALFERLALIDALHASKCGLRMTTKQIFLSAFDLCAERFRPANWGLLPYVIIVLHFGTITDISGITSFISIPGYILESIEKHPWQYMLYLAFTIAMLYLFLRWIFTLPVMMEDDATDFRAARRKSREMTRGKYMFHILFIHLFWHLVSGLLYFIAAVLADTAWYLLALWLTPGTTGSYTTFLVRNFTPTFIITYIAISWLAGPMFLAAYQSAYYRRKEELGMALKEYTEGPGYLKKYPVLRILVMAVAAVCIF
ncbi:MAG: glycerophosphoryl diester phosphodiesterase membrane domain-containing protein, partial [Parasporobacterium sp.]|nr:glycerophosphoryl diester phosphodiesterase membrane domain-containing protein [Parasporobacterium sp.]